MASTAIILAVVNLFCALASIRSMAYRISLAMINIAIVYYFGMKRRNPESTLTSSPSFGINYEVFLSFRGANTRRGFTDHLYIRLVDAGIAVFRDDEELRAGEEINLSLIDAIKRSRISIAILSRDYASSKSCLMELVQMWECRKSNGQTIIPIFYDISPSDVKHQTGDFGRAFDQHVQKRVDADTIQTWKGVLQQIGELSGYEGKNINGGHEAQLVIEVLTRVRQVLKRDAQVVTDGLVGIDFHVQEMMRKLGVVYSDEQAIEVCGGDVRVVGIWGIRGVGKTTLARAVYNKMHVLFKECSFLEDINSEGVVSSQERLIASLNKRKREALKSYTDGIKNMESLFTNMKVLIVLDDVREVEQIKGLAGKLTWFGPGSRIIVTTYRRDVLNGFDHGAVEKYEVGRMRDHHALQLFRKHAFQGDAPQDVSKYDSLSIDIVKAIGGLPKAIEIQASYLSQKRDDIEAWTNTLDSLRRHPPEGVKTLFDIGYESLDPHRKKIFLDIACFFVGNDERIPTYMWKACDCYPPMGIDPLRNLRWLEDGENNELRMDNMIRDFGRDIVKSKLVHKRCRFWNQSDALSILKNYTAIEIQASYLSRNRDDIEAWTNTLDSLRRHPPEGAKTLFHIGYESLDPHKKKIFLDIACFFIGNDERIPTHMRKACDCYPPMGIDPLRNLRWLEDGENNELRMDNMIRDFGRDIVKSKLVHKRRRFWNQSDALSILKNCTGTKRVEGINLTVEEDCTDTIECEQFWKMSNLRYLRLDRAKIQGDTTKLPPNLRWLDWQECHLINELHNMHLKELVILDLSRSRIGGDSNIWSQIIKKVEKLKVLNLKGCDLSGAALDFPGPINLEILILEGCTQLTEIKKFISKLEKLKSLNLRGCKEVKELPEEQHCMKSLTELLIDRTGIKKIEVQIGFLKNLETLSARGCEKLEDISTIGHLENLRSLDLDDAIINGLPDNFKFARTLKRLSLRNCWKLGELPTAIGKLELLEVMDLSYTRIMKLPRSVKDLRKLKTLKMAHTSLRKFPEDIVNLAKLEEIDFSVCRSLEGELPSDISGLSSLRILKLSSSNVAGLPQSICCLSRLQILDISECNRLHTLPKLHSSLLSLRWGSKKLRLPDLSYLTNLKELLLTDGEQPKAGWLMMLLNLMTPNMGWITRLPSLETLQLSLSKVTNLPGNFSALIHLRELSLSYVQKLDLSQLPSTSSLSTLRLKHCKIRKPKFSSLQHLSELELEDCEYAKIDGFENLKLLEVLKISHCSSPTNLNGLEMIGRLRKVEVISSPLAILPQLSECVEVARCD